MWDDEASGSIRAVVDVFRYERGGAWSSALASGVFLKLADGSVMDA